MADDHDDNAVEETTKDAKSDPSLDPSKPLPNRKHELFAQQLAMGKSAAEAYRSTGYKPSDSNAHRLSRNEQVAARVSYLCEEADRDAAVAKTITRDWVLSRLRDNALAALAESNGGAAQRAAANRALELLGKEVAGMFVERHDIKVQAGVETVLSMVRPHMSPHAFSEFIDALAIAAGISSGVEGVDSETAREHEEGPSTH